MYEHNNIICAFAMVPLLKSTSILTLILVDRIELIQTHYEAVRTGFAHITSVDRGRPDRLGWSMLGVIN
jgi:hypothetical protein